MGFKLIETQDLPDIQSVGNIYQDERTGAKVLHLVNDDANKAFTIGFKTPPYNDNGITHILEHSVLNGSKKYPSKEPFVELIKGSLNTFINAMTFSDKTIYPVASTNQKDFVNLMGVYLDAVFQPKIYTDPQILEQEGWHYHLENAEDELTYNGVVFNEMKGATASPERQLYMQMQKHLYEDTIYRHESGGLPAAIPSLTNEEFIDFHQKYYHPSNSFTILYGDLDLDAAFALLDEYFAEYEGQEMVDELTFEAKVPAQTTVEETYSITEGDDPTDKDFLALAWHVTEPDDALDAYGLRVLSDILFGNNQAPLKKALLDAEIGGDIDGGYDEIGYSGAFMVEAKYAKGENIEALKTVVKDTLTKLVAEKLDAELVTAAINKITFQLKEAAISESNPRGVVYAIGALGTWLYDASPFTALEFSTYLEQLTELAEEGYFEALIERKLLNNPINLALVLRAEPGKNSRLEQEAHEALQAHKATLSESEIEEIVTKTQALMQRQSTPDRPEDLAAIPTLTREDLTTDVEHLPLESSELFDGTYFYHADQFTSGIDYVNLYIDVADFDADEFAALSYMSSLVAQLATNNYDAARLQTDIDLYTGGIYGKVSIFENKDGVVKPYFVLQGKALENFFPQLIALMKEIITQTQFDDFSEIMKLTQRMISNFEQMIDMSAHALAASRAASQFKAAGKLNELTDGIDQFNYLKEARSLIKEGTTDALMHTLKALLIRLLNKDRLNVLYVGANDRAATVKNAVQEAFAELPSNPLLDRVNYDKGVRQNEAFVTAQDVNYVALAADAKDILPYNGAANVLSTAVRFDYLWNNIRVKGGAYGSMYRHQRNGNFMLASYRDPNIQPTLNVYHGLPEFVGSLKLSESELLKYIIGTISPLEQPLSAFAKGLRAFSMHQLGLETADIVKLKEEILASDNEQLTALAEDFQKVLEDHSVVVIGNKEQIEAANELFDAVYDLY